MAHSGMAGRSVPPTILNVLEVVRAGRAHTVRDIAELTELPEPDVARWSRRLADWRLLEATESGSYHAGLVLGLTGDGSPMAAAGFLPELSGVTHGRVRLGVLHRSGVAYVEQRPLAAAGSRAAVPLVAAGSPPAVQLVAAGSRPAAASAIGHALLAFRSEQGTPSPVARQQPADPPTGSTVRSAADDASVEKLALALAVTRLSGVAITRRRRRGRGFRVAVPVRGAAGTAVVAIELTTRDLGEGFSVLLDALFAASRSIARRLDLPDGDGTGDAAAPVGRP